MGSWPFTRLHFGCGRCVAISGPYIQILDAISGQIQHTAHCANTILCSTVDKEYTHLITTGEDKKLEVWGLDSLRLKSSRELSKKATMVQLSHDGETILVADKFGDVFAYPLTPPTNIIPTLSDASQASHENPHGSLVLGHASIITSFLLSPDGRHIITADRDEHIRVSRYPHGYIIDRYCLGHQLYVSAICLPSFDPCSLVSGGGDPSLHVWDWMTGTLKCQLPVLDAVTPFLKVKGGKQKWHWRSEGNPSGCTSQNPLCQEKNEKEASNEMEIEAPLSPACDVTTVGTGEFVFALAKLEAHEFNGEKLLVFNAIGGSALFYCTYPSQASDVPSVRHIDFSRPILDFVLAFSNQIVVSVDAAWSQCMGELSETSIEIVEWQKNEFKLLDVASQLLTSFNGSALQKASAAELASLDLYSGLALLPKHADGSENGNWTGDQGSETRHNTPKGSRREGRKQHAKVVGRLKTKQALLKKQQELDQEGSRCISEDEHESKKVKLDHGTCLL
ncbi:WD40 repeat-like protein [Ramaria rubella]|nr:WD40 repeat-like protein [Ramaria rubella]